jgi:hypothetical protein
MMKLDRRFWILATVVLAVGGVNGWDFDGANGFRGVLAGIVAGAFFVTVYIASRATVLRPTRMIVNGSAGLICGCLVAGLVGRGPVGVIGCGFVGVLLGVGADVWLSRF